jgi:hypothetical protein
MASFTDQILEVIKKLANERETFTSDDLRPLLPEGATPMQIPAAVSMARRLGLVEEVDRVKSKIPERKGSLVPVLRRPGSSIALVGSASSGAISNAIKAADDELVSKTAKELDALRAYLELNGYVIGIEELTSIILLLAGREWLILSGPSGTGKSSLVRHVCSAVSGRFHDVQVKPNWVSSEDSLGYFSEVGQVYVPGVLLSAFIEAQQEPDQLHFIRLDEMNLAPPEYYVAEVLSAAEEWHSGSDKRWWSSEIQLPPSPEGVVIPKVRVASSVFMVGTVNVDETTKVLSPKVLDRAAVYDLHFVDLFAAPDATTEPGENGVLPAPALPQLLSLLRDRPRSLRASGYRPDQLEAVANVLNALVDVATPLGGPIGYRQRDALVILLALSERHGLDSVLTRDSVLDIGVATCVMPKWQGSTPSAARALRRALEVLIEVDIPEDLSIDAVRPQVALCRFPRSAERLLAMLEQYDQLGFFSAW